MRTALLLIALAVAAAPPDAVADPKPRAESTKPKPEAESTKPKPEAAKAKPKPEAAKPRWESLPLPPPMPKAVASGYVEAAGGARIYYAQYGKASGPAVILLHGGLGNGDHFAHQVPALADRFRVIAIDSRGQGRSTLGQGKLGYPEMARDVVAVMDALALERASMVGWSDGGAIALALGISHAARVDKLFVFGTNYDSRGARPRSGPSPTFAAYAAKCRADHGRLAGAPKGAYDAASRALAPVWRDPRPFTKQQLRSIRAPTLVAGADHDELVLLDQVKEMAALIPAGRLAVLEGVSHFALWQDPAGFNKALADFLAPPRAR